MKKTGILAVALTASLLVVPLAACGEGAEYKPADYAYTLQSEEVESSLTKNTLYTKATKVEGKIVPFTNNSNEIALANIAKVRKANGKYALYDLENQKLLLNGNEYDSIEYNPEAHLIGLMLENTTDPDDMQIGLCTVTGDEFLTVKAYEDVDFNSVKGYMNGSYKQITVYSVTYTTENATKETTKYYTFDEKTNKTTVVSSSEFRTTAIDMSAGTTSNAVELNEIYEDGKENPLSAYAYAMEISSFVDNPICDVTYAATLTAYKDGAVTGSVSLENGALLGTVGNYLYYYEVTALSQSATSGYNVEYQTEQNDVISTAKFDYTLYRYDIVKGGEAKEVKADYLFTDYLNPLYNNTANAYDKAAASGYEFVKGVAFISDEVMPSELIVDDTLAVSYNQTGKPYSVARLIQLKENRYLAMGKQGTSAYILDEKLEAVANIPALRNLYADQQLIVCAFGDYSNVKYMAVDFDGKVVFEPKYSALNFYGDYAKADVTEKSGKVNSDMFVSKTNPEGKSLEDLFSDYEDDGVNYVPRNNGYILKSVTGSTSTAYSLYNYAGNKIVDLDGMLSDQVVSVGDKLLVTVTKDGTTPATYTYIITGAQTASSGAVIVDGVVIG